jgi:hypothetical protein
MTNQTSESQGIDFTTFVLSVSSAAYMGLGLTPKPGKATAEVDLELARQNIDLLEMIKVKTRNNLSGDEQKLLDNLLYETRMRFIEIQSQKKGS